VSVTVMAVFAFPCTESGTRDAQGFRVDAAQTLPGLVRRWAETYQGTAQVFRCRRRASLILRPSADPVAARVACQWRASNC
jgi:hypothetical protein